MSIFEDLSNVVFADERAAYGKDIPTDSNADTIFLLKVKRIFLEMEDMYMLQITEAILTLYL